MITFVCSTNYSSLEENKNYSFHNVTSPFFLILIGTILSLIAFLMKDDDTYYVYKYIVAALSLLFISYAVYSLYVLLDKERGYIGELNKLSENKSNSDSSNTQISQRIIQQTTADFKNIEFYTKNIKSIASTEGVSINNNDIITLLNLYADNFSKDIFNGSELLKLENYKKSDYIDKIIARCVLLQNSENLSDDNIKNNKEIINKMTNVIDLITKDISNSKRISNINLKSVIEFVHAILGLISDKEVVEDQFVNLTKKNDLNYDLIIRFLSILNFNTVEELAQYIKQNKLSNQSLGQFIHYILNLMNNENEEILLQINRCVADLLGKPVTNQDIAILLKNMKNMFGTQFVERYEKHIKNYSDNKTNADTAKQLLQTVFNTTDINKITNIFKQKKLNNLNEVESMIKKRLDEIQKKKQILQKYIEQLQLNSVNDLELIITNLSKLLTENKVNFKDIKAVTEFLTTKQHEITFIKAQIDAMLNLLNLKNIDDLQRFVISLNGLIHIFNVQINDIKSLDQAIGSHKNQLEFIEKISSMLSNIYGETVSIDNVSTKFADFLGKLADKNITLDDKELINKCKEIHSQFLLAENFANLAKIFGITREEMSQEKNIKSITNIVTQIMRLLRSESLKSLNDGLQFITKTEVDKVELELKANQILNLLDNKISLNDLSNFANSLSNSDAANMKQYLDNAKLSLEAFTNLTRLNHALSEISPILTFGDFVKISMFLGAIPNWGSYLRTMDANKKNSNIILDKLYGVVNQNSLNGVVRFLKALSIENKPIEEQLSQVILSKDEKTAILSLGEKITKATGQIFQNTYEILSYIIELKVKFEKFGFSFNEIVFEKQIKEFLSPFSSDIQSVLKKYLIGKFELSELLSVLSNLDTLEKQLGSSLSELFKTKCQKLMEILTKLQNSGLTEVFSSHDAQAILEDINNFQLNINNLLNSDACKTLKLDNIKDLCKFLASLLSLKDHKLAENITVEQFVTNDKTLSILKNLSVIDLQKIVNEIDQMRHEMDAIKFKGTWQEFLFQHPKMEIIKKFYNTINSIAYTDHVINSLEESILYNSMNLNPSVSHFLYGLIAQCLEFYTKKLPIIQREFNSVNYNTVDFDKLSEKLLEGFNIYRYIAGIHFLSSLLKLDNTITTHGVSQILNATPKVVLQSEMISGLNSKITINQKDTEIIFQTPNTRVVYNRLKKATATISNNNDFFITYFGKVEVKPPCSMNLNPDGSVKILGNTYNISLNGFKDVVVNLWNDKISIKNYKLDTEILLPAKDIKITKLGKMYITIVKSEKKFLAKLFLNFKSIEPDKCDALMTFTGFDEVYAPVIYDGKFYFLVQNGDVFFFIVSNKPGGEISIINKIINYNGQLFKISDNVLID